MAQQFLVNDPFTPFTVNNQFKAIANGKVYVGIECGDPLNVSQQIQVYHKNGCGDYVPVSQPISTNAGGFLSYNGGASQFVVKQPFSIVVKNANNVEEWRVDKVFNLSGDDWNGFSNALLSEAGITPSGLPDTATESQRLDAMNALFSNYNGVTSAILKVKDLAPIVGIHSFDDGSLSNPLSDHTSVIQASWAFSSLWGVKIVYPAGTYNYTTLTLKDKMQIQGSGQNNCFLLCSTTAGSSDPILWSIKKSDDGLRARNIKIEDFYIARAVSGVAAAQDVNPNLGGLCLAACEGSVTNNLRFTAFGQGGIVLARAEAGAEGLGFTGTTQDGNYNTGVNLTFGSCGKYNTAKAAMWFKYKANSNNYTGVYGKGNEGARTLGFTVANNNNVYGGSAESSLGIASFSPTGILNCSGNNVNGMRAEVVTGDAYLLKGVNCTNNNVRAGYLTGVAGLNANYADAPSNIIDIPGTKHFGSESVFPVSTNAAALHNKDLYSINSLQADSGTRPLYRTTKAYNVAGQYVEVIDYNTLTVASSGTVMNSWGAHCNDASSGAKGVNARIEARAVDTVGSLAWYVMAGRASDGLTDVLKIGKFGVEILDSSIPIIAKSPDGTRYKLTPPNGGGAATWVAA